MEVILAGMNIDFETLRDSRRLLAASAGQLAGEGGATAGDEQLAEEIRAYLGQENLTPETLSAAYARISRDPRPVDELRRLARREVDRARRSNERIIFGLGHASVAEHAVFNLDIRGVSRLAAEFVERFRLCSYTEKSQRYVTLEGDFVVPPELAGGPLEPPFRALLERQADVYGRFRERLQVYFTGRYPELAATEAGRRTLDGWAKEDARYCFSLAVQSQLGMTANARNLENIIRKAAAHPLAEVREYGRRLAATVTEHVPSLVKYTRPEAFEQTDWPDLLRSIEAGVAAAGPSVRPVKARPPSGASLCRLAGAVDCGDQQVLAAMAFEAGGADWAACRDWARRVTPARGREILARLSTNMAPYQALPRCFEAAVVSFDCVMSASCFAQFKRHRMGTLLAQDYDPGLGLTVPPSVREAGLAGELKSLSRESESLWRDIRVQAPAAAPYALTNAHRRRVFFQTNLRELVHFSRLRLDAHAQWDIRELAVMMASRLARQFPLFGALLCGKDAWSTRSSPEL